MNQEQTVAELTRLDAEFQRAVGAKDVAAVAKFLADDYILVTASSRIMTKQELLKEIAPAGLTWEMNASREVSVRVYGDTAIVTALLEQKGVDNNELLRFASALHRYVAARERHVAADRSSRIAGQEIRNSAFSGPFTQPERFIRVAGNGPWQTNHPATQLRNRRSARDKAQNS